MGVSPDSSFFLISKHASSKQYDVYASSTSRSVLGFSP